MRKLLAVVIPCYRVRAQILPLLASIGSEVDRIVVVDDCCPEQSGLHVEEGCSDPRVTVLKHTHNQGVGGAMVTGYRHVLQLGTGVVVKLDGDGQMDPRWIKHLVQPIQSGVADYAKGNRFFRIEGLRSMPRIRLIGNAVLSFLSKIGSGYWRIFDPTNGYTAISTETLSLLPLEKISRDYFFESDMLFQLGLVRACVVDVPMPAIYGDETSSLVISRLAFRFLSRHISNTLKRIGYNYFLRDFSLASVELVAGSLLTLFGVVFGGYHWRISIQTHMPATTGTVMLAALPVILGFQLLLSFVAYDIGATPNEAIHRLLKQVRGPERSAEASPEE